MIHHVSIPAGNPRRVAEVLAELWGGRALPFPGLDGAYWVGPGDESGSMIDVYPLTTHLVPGLDKAPAEFVDSQIAPTFIVAHALISVPASKEQIVAVGVREGWRTVPCWRRPQGVDAFELIEFWMENRVLIELLTREATIGYARYMHPANPVGMFAQCSVKRSA